MEDAEVDGADEATWIWLGTVVQERREKLGLTQGDVRERSGGGDRPRVSVANLSKLETGRSLGLKPRTKHGLALALNWPSDAIDLLLGGTDPADLEDVDYGLLREPTDTTRALLDRQTARENWWKTFSDGGPPGDLVAEERARLLSEIVMRHDEVLGQLTEQVQALAERVAALVELPDAPPAPPDPAPHHRAR